MSTPPFDPETGEVLRPTDQETTVPETEEADPTPPFSQWLFAQRKGALHGELTDALAELAEQVRDTGRPGSMTITIKVAPVGKGGGHQLVVSDQVGVKPPKAERGESLFFFDEDTGGLSRNDPMQQQLPLQQVPNPAAIKKEA